MRRAIHYSAIMSSILIGYVRGNALPAYQPENSLWRPAWMIMHAASCPPMGSKAAAHTASWMPTATLPQRRRRDSHTRET